MITPASMLALMASAVILSLWALSFRYDMQVDCPWPGYGFCLRSHGSEIELFAPFEIKPGHSPPALLKTQMVKVRMRPPKIAALFSIPRLETHERAGLVYVAFMLPYWLLTLASLAGISALLLRNRKRMSAYHASLREMDPQDKI